MKTSASKTVLLSTFLLATVSLGTAFTTSATTTNTSNVQPGENNSVGNITVTAESPSTFEVDTSQTPYALSAAPSSFSLDQGQTQNITLTASPESTFPAGTYNATVTISNSSTSKNETFETTVLEDYGFNTSKNNITGKVSVGTQGQLGNTSVYLTGNVDQQTIQTSLTGNLSQYLAVPDSFQVYSYDNYTLAPTFQVGSSVPRGFYNATLALEGVNNRRNISLETVFVDDTDPEILDTEFSDVMALQETNFTVRVRDNQNISKVEAEILRPTTRMEGNETVRFNESFTNLSFSPESSNSQTWFSAFSDTDTRGQYYAEVTVTDSSNNTANTTTSFQVNRLNTTQVLNSNFQFDAVEPGDQAEKNVVRITDPTDVELTLEDFDYDKNSSVTVGIRKPGDEVITEFDNISNTSSIDIEESGVYSLVVEGGTVQDFDGDLVVQPPEQHLNLSTVRFAGSIIDPEYPDTGNYTLNEFQGIIGFDSTDDTEKDRVWLNLSTDASKCKGFDSWKQCFGNSYSLGEIEEIKENNQKLRNKASRWQKFGVGAALLSLILVAVFIRTQNLGYKIPTVNKTPK